MRSFLQHMKQIVEWRIALPPILYLALRWVLRAFSLAVLMIRHNREPNSLLAWSLTILFLPWLGLPLYLIFGDSRLPKHYQERLSELDKRLASLQKRLQDAARPPDEVLDDESVQLTKVVKSLSGMPVSDGNTLDVHTEYEATIDAIIADIDQARDHVHVLTYIYSDDDIGRKFTDALVAAADRGVEVRVLADAAGSSSFLGDLDDRFEDTGIKYHPSLPMTSFQRTFTRFDLRNHRKLVVIDGHTAWMGSQNIVNKSYDTDGKLEWQDMMARVHGQIVNHLQFTFVQNWFTEAGELLNQTDYFPTVAPNGDFAMQVLPSSPSDPVRNYQQVAITAIHAARRRVCITTPYLVPNAPLMGALQTVLLRGVEVTLMVPEHTNHLFVDVAARAYFDDLLAMGVDIQFFQGGLLHAKSLTVDDDLAFVSSGNFDIRSFELNFELTLIQYNLDAVKQVRSVQDQYLRNCRKLTRKEWSKRRVSHRIVQNAAKMLSPLL